MLSIEIKDFQSLKHVKLEVVPGINIITGKTNQGKSAVIRAIDAALFNLGDDSMVRGGKRYSGVSIDNGTHKMVFCRDCQGKNEKTAYQLDDGTVQKKVGRSQLPEVAQMFNIRDVRMQNNSKMKINFWYQNDKPFLMDKTSGQLYEFLSLSSCDKYTRILKKMIVDMKVQEADINNITTEIDTLKAVNNRKEEFIKKNVGFDDLYVRIMETDQERRSLESLERILNGLKDVSLKVSECKRRMRTVKERFDRIPMEYLHNTYEECISRFSECRVLNQRLKIITDLSSRIQDSGQELSNVVDDYNSSELILGKAQDEISCILDTLRDLNSQSSLVQRCKSTRYNIETVKSSMVNISDKLSLDISNIESSLSYVINSRESVREIESLMSRVVVVSDRIKKKSYDVEKTTKDLSEAEVKLKELKENAGYCPFCGTVFSN